MKIEIQIEHPPGDDIVALLQEHHSNMLLHSPPQSVHALDLSSMQVDDLCFWSARVNRELAACGGLKELNRGEGEVKSMKTAQSYLRQGIASKVMAAIVAESRSRNYQRLYLETGSTAVFNAARTLYVQFGFSECSPFADYEIDPSSVFMCKNL